MLNNSVNCNDTRILVKIFGQSSFPLHHVSRITSSIYARHFRWLNCFATILWRSKAIHGSPTFTVPNGVITTWIYKACGFATIGIVHQSPFDFVSLLNVHTHDSNWIEYVPLHLCSLRNHCNTYERLSMIPSSCMLDICVHWYSVSKYWQ